MSSVQDSLVLFPRSRRSQRVFVPITRAIVERARKNAAAFNNAAAERFQSGDLPQARELLLRAAAIRPECAVTAFNLGLVLQKSNQTQEATTWYERSIARFNGNAQAHFNLGFCHRSLGRKGKSEAAFRAGLKIDPRRSDIFLVLGIICVERGDPEAAARAFSRGLAVDANHATLHAYLGTALKDLGDAEGAIAELKCALELDPRLEYARFNLVRALQLRRSRVGAAQAPDAALAASGEDSRI